MRLLSKAEKKGYNYEERLAQWAIKARYLTYPVAVFLFLFFFRHQHSIYPYFILAAAIPFIVNIALDYLYRYHGARYPTEVAMAVFDALITAYAVFLTGGFRSPFFFFFLVQLLGVGLLSNVGLTLLFLFIDIALYSLASDLKILLYEGRFVFINQRITDIVRYVQLTRIDYLLINVVVFALIVVILAFVNYRLNIITGKLSSNEKKLDFLLNMADKFRKLEPLDSFLSETVKMISDTLEYPYNAIVLLNGDKTELRISSHNPKSRAGRQQLDRINNLLGFDLSKLRLPMSSGNNIAVRAVKEMVTLVTHDERDVLADVIPGVPEENIRLIQGVTGNRTYILVPIIVLGDVIGVLEVESLAEKADAEDIEILERFVSQIGIGIVNSRLYTETLEQKKEIERHYQEMNEVLGELQQSYAKLESFTSELEISKSKMEEMKSILYHTDKLANIGQVIASITHQFSTPITAITGQVELLIKELADKGIDVNKDRIGKIQLGINKLNESVKKLMLSVRETKSDFRPVQVNDIVKSVAALWEYELKTMGITFTTKLAGDLPLIEGIPDAIEQLLVNLVSNARDAMEYKKGTITVATRLFDKNNAELEVADEGVGISDDYLDKIFTPFFTTKPAGKGTGLGMVIVMNAVEEHRGRLMVKSELNKGTKFTIIFPIRHRETYDHT